jgi:hypothetical protein
VFGPNGGSRNLFGTMFFGNVHTNQQIKKACTLPLPLSLWLLRCRYDPARRTNVWGLMGAPVPRWTQGRTVRVTSQKSFYPTSRVRSYGPKNCINVNKRFTQNDTVCQFTRAYSQTSEASIRLNKPRSPIWFRTNSWSPH